MTSVFRRSNSLVLLAACSLMLPAVGYAQRKKAPQRPQAAPDGFGADRVVVYKKVGDVALKLYLFLPEQADPPRPGAAAAASRPAIVFFFGGGWRGGTPGQFRHQAAYLAGRGMVAALAEYRVYARHRAKVADCVADARSAVRFLRQHAAEYRIDPQRIAAAGGSAGGHLAAATATLTQFDEPTENKNVPAEPNALILFNPALDLRPEAFPEAFRSDRYKELRERMGAAPEALSPTLHIRRGTPPTIIFHGEADSVVPIEQARAFCRRMKELGNSCRVVAFAGQGHGFFNYGRSQNTLYEQTLQATDAFLVELGWLQPLPAPKQKPSGTPPKADRQKAEATARTGRLVEQRPDGWIVLHARDAVPHGQRIVYEPEPHKNTIGYWTVPSDWVAWSFRIHKPGRFAVEILQGCGAGNGGSDVEIAVGAQRLRFKVYETGHFQNFIPRDVGVVDIERPGRYELTVRCLRKAAKAVMDLRRIRLVPETADGSPVPIHVAGEPFLRGDEHVVFIGDSITQAGAYVDQVETILLGRYPDRSWRFTKLGLGSETVCGLTEPDHPFPRPNVHDRLSRILEVTRPDVLVVCYGMNDGIYYPFSEERFAAYRRGMEKLVAAARAVGARITLMTPPPFDSLAKQKRGGVFPVGHKEYGYKTPFQGYDEVLERYGQWILETKWPEGVRTVDVHEPLVRLVAAGRREDVDFTVAPDGIHPNALGHWAMAKALLGGWGLLPDQTRIRIPVTTPPGGRALRFSIHTAVPFPVDLDAQTRADRVAWVFGTRCQTVLEIAGATRGTYQICEQTGTVGRATAAELAEGIDIRSWPRALPARRAQELFELVRKRRSIVAPALLAHIGHKRPMRQQPRPLAEALAEAAPLKDRIRQAKQPVAWSFELKPAGELPQ